VSGATRLFGVLSAAVVVSSIACGDDATTTPTATTTSPTTVTWTTLLSARGSASRSFVASQFGTVSITLQASPVPIGIGIGVLAQSESGCRPSSTLTASPGDGPQLTAAVQPGNYCVLVFDVGGIGIPGDQMPFTIQIVYP
jgi:hypothetical protein